MKLLVLGEISVCIILPKGSGVSMRYIPTD